MSLAECEAVLMTDVQDPLVYSHFGRGHPGAFLHSFRDCVRMVRGGGHWRWHETPCTVLKWQYKFICEYGTSIHV